MGGAVVAGVVVAGLLLPGITVLLDLALMVPVVAAGNDTG